MVLLLLQLLLLGQDPRHLEDVAEIPPSQVFADDQIGLLHLRDEHEFASIQYAIGRRRRGGGWRRLLYGSGRRRRMVTVAIVGTSLSILGNARFVVFVVVAFIILDALGG